MAGRRSFIWACRHRPAQATYLLLMPGPGASILVLQAVGFALPAMSPSPRCALTAPFHLCLPRLLGTSAVYFLWHFPAGCPGWPLAITVPCPARTFLPAPILKIDHRTISKVPFVNQRIAAERPSTFKIGAGRPPDPLFNSIITELRSIFQR